MRQANLNTKKAMILDLWNKGEHDIWHIAHDMATRPSYVASVLQDAGLIHGYFDLYTSTANAMNIYAGAFTGQLGFKDAAAARRSVRHIDEVYRRLREVRDRAGQHHCLVVAMTMFNRARWSGKTSEAEIFRHWLMMRLSERESESLSA
jgi:hypothetical protein